jgi:hypothetical protein
MTFDDIRQIALSFPGVEEHQVFNSPTFKVGKRFLASIAKIDPNTLCLKVPSQLEREYLLNTKPDVYYMQEHYANFQCVLVRIPVADPAELRNLFEDAWRAYAPKRIVAAYQNRQQTP